MKKLQKKEKNRDAWMTTYSDMVTLLMVFFVMLIAFGDVKVVKTQIILSAFSGKLGVLSGGQSLESTKEFETLGESIESLPSSRNERSLERNQKEATEILNPHIKSKRVRVIENEEGIIISLFTDAFFQQGKADVKLDEVREILENIRLLLDSENFSGDVLIEGHTDNTPYYGTEYGDEWDLSSARALSILNALRLLPAVLPLDEDRISVHGYGPNRPIEDNQTPQGRAYNRRVDIVIKNN